MNIKFQNHIIMHLIIVFIIVPSLLNTLFEKYSNLLISLKISFPVNGIEIILTTILR